MREEEKQYNMKKLGNESTRGGKIGEGGGVKREGVCEENKFW